MQTVDIQKIIDQHGLDVDHVAEQLFPGHKYPRLAYNRVKHGKGTLDTNQVSKLALLTGRSISSLYSGEEWKAKTKENLHVFTNGEYRAELDTQTWVTKIFHNNSLFHEAIIHSSTIPLQEYLMEIDKIILKNKK